MAYLVKRITGDYKLNVHEAIIFVDINDINKYDFLPADIPIAEKLIKNNSIKNYNLLKR